MITKIGSLGRFGGPLLIDRIIGNSITVAINDSVRTASGFLALGTAGSRVLGHVESFIGQDGLTPVKDGTLLQNPGATFVSAANNQTVAQVRVRVDAAKDALYSADLDAAVGTTSTAGGSGVAGKNFALINEDTLDEDTFSEVLFALTEGTPNTVAFRQYASHGVDRNDSTNIIVNVLYSEVFGI